MPCRASEQDCVEGAAWRRRMMANSVEAEALGSDKPGGHPGRLEGYRLNDNPPLKTVAGIGGRSRSANPKAHRAPDRVAGDGRAILPGETKRLASEVLVAEMDTRLAANRAAIGDLIAAAERAGGVWTIARAPGKWSPSQIVEHVARALDESANVVSGAPSKFPKLPFFLRPVVRGFLFNRVLKSGAFPKARTNKAMDPAVGPATPAEARVRLEGALARFDQECRACEKADGVVASATFGRVSVADYARFIELHTRHHCKQMPGGT
jgi:hypothetical protein